MGWHGGGKGSLTLAKATVNIPIIQSNMGVVPKWRGKAKRATGERICRVGLGKRGGRRL